MKLNSTQRNNEIDVSNSVKDELYSIYLREFETRGISYFNWLAMMPEASGGLLSVETPLLLIKRLAVNPSIISVMLSHRPGEALMRLIHSDDNDIQVTHVTDFLDDITLNCRLRDPELYNRNYAIFMDQLKTIAEVQTNMNNEELEDYNTCLKRYGYLLMTLHYLRKIGYNYVFKERNSQA